jgi:hypothetical protein
MPYHAGYLPFVDGLPQTGENIRAGANEAKQERIKTALVCIRMA